MANEAVQIEMDRLEARRAAAVLAADIAALNDLLSDHLLYCHSTGVIDSKAMFLDKIAQRRSIFHAFEARSDAAIEPVRGTRIMAGNLLVDVEIGGTVYNVRGRFLAVWCLEEENWCLQAFQGVGG